MKRLNVVMALAVAGGFAFAPLPSQAQIYLGPEIAWNDDADLGIGAGIEFDLPSLYQGLSFHGDFIFFFPGEDFDYFEFNTNLTYDLPLEDAPVVPFALAGLNVGRVSVSEFDDTEVGLNLGGGIKFDVGSFRPRVAARFVLGGAEGFTIFAFLPFRIGN